MRAAGPVSVAAPGGRFVRVDDVVDVGAAVAAPVPPRVPSSSPLLGALGAPLDLHEGISDPTLAIHAVEPNAGGARRDPSGSRNTLSYVPDHEPMHPVTVRISAAERGALDALADAVGLSRSV